MTDIPDASNLLVAAREVLLAENCLDFDEILSAAVRLLRDNPDLPSRPFKTLGEAP